MCIDKESNRRFFKVSLVVTHEIAYHNRQEFAFVAVLLGYQMLCLPHIHVQILLKWKTGRHEIGNYLVLFYRPMK